MTKSFLNGYRAFVMGGRRSRVVGRKTEHFDGVEPFDDLTDKQKAEWQAGVEYAKREREECRKLWKKTSDEPSPNSALARPKIEKKKEIARKLLRNGIPRPVVAKAVGLSYTTIFYLENARRN